MKYKNKIRPKDSFLFIQSLDSESLAALNSIFNTHYTKSQVKKNNRTQRASRKFKFWKKLMETPPGSDRGANG